MYAAAVAAIQVERRELRTQRRQINYIYIWGPRYAHDQCVIALIRNATTRSLRVIVSAQPTNGFLKANKLIVP